MGYLLSKTLAHHIHAIKSAGDRLIFQQTIHQLTRLNYKYYEIIFTVYKWVLPKSISSATINHRRPWRSVVRCFLTILHGANSWQLCRKITKRKERCCHRLNALSFFCCCCWLQKLFFVCLILDEAYQKQILLRKSWA